MQAANQESPPAPGHNNPPSISTALSDGTQGLAAEIAALAQRATDTPRVIAGDDDLGKAGRLVIDARDLLKKIELRRTAEKEPYLTGGREVDAFFKGMIDRVDRVRAVFQQISDDYQRARAEAARKAAAETAAKARAEEDRRRELAAKADANNRAKHAAGHEAKANEEAAKAAEAEAIGRASAADLTRTATSTGVKASAQSNWDFEIEAIDKIDLEALRPFIAQDAIDKAIRQFVRSGRRQLSGVRIFEAIKANFRS